MIEDSPSETTQEVKGIYAEKCLSKAWSDSSGVFRRK